MKDVTAVRDITRGGAMAIPDVEMVDWSNWSKELAVDWFSVSSSYVLLSFLRLYGLVANPLLFLSRSKPSQTGGPPKKRIKLSPSPSKPPNSDPR